MPTEAVELVFKFSTQKSGDIDDMKNKLLGVASAANAGNNSLLKFQQTTRNTEQSLAGSILKVDLLTGAFTRLASALRGAAEYKARTDQLAIVTDSLSRVNGLSVQGVRAQAEAVRKLGITDQVTNEAIARVIQARLKVSDAPQLARIAQDAAKIMGGNSSEALEKMITAIGAGTSRPLHQMGLMVNFQSSYAQYAAVLRKSTEALTEQERAEARAQATIKQGPGILGAYAASQLTAAGQMQSLSRYTDDLKNKFGEGLQPALFTIIGTFQKLTKAMGDSVDKTQDLTAGAAGLAAAGTVFAATSFIPSLAARAGIAAIAGFGTAAFVDQDPAKVQMDRAREQISLIEDRRRSGQLTPADAAKAEDALQKEETFQLAHIFQQRQARGQFMGDVSRLKPDEIANLKQNGKEPEAFALALGYKTKSAYPDLVPLGAGRVITRSQLEHEFDADPNGNLNPPALEDDDAIKAFQDLVKEHAKSLRGQVNSSALQLLSGTARIDAQTKNMRAELGTALLGFSDKQLASPQVGQLYGYINTVGKQELAKYNRERALKVIDYNAELALANRDIDTKKKKPGDLDDATVEYRSSVDTAGKHFIYNRNWAEYQDSMDSAQIKMARARRSSAEAINAADIGSQVSGLNADASLKLRLLGVSKTDQNAGSVIGQEYQIKIQTAAREFAITGELQKLREKIASDYGDKIVATAEHEKQLLEKQKADRIEIIQSESQFHSKMAAITAGPRDQYSAIRNAYKESLDSALQVYAVNQKADELKKKTLAAEHEMEISIAQLSVQGLEQYEATAGKVFDAILAKNGNRGNAFRQLMLTEGESVAKKMFTNAAGLTFGSFQKLGIGDLVPGQYEKNPDGTPKIDPRTGNPTLTTAGKILQGTPLGTNQAKLAAAGIEKSIHSTDFNTTATKDNTDAIRQLTAAIERILGLRSGGLSAGVHSVGGGGFKGFGGGGGVNTNSVIFAGGGGGGGAFPVSSGGTSSSIFIPMMGGDGNPEGGYSPAGTSSSTFTPMMLPGYLGGGGGIPDSTADVLPGGALANTAAAPYFGGYTPSAGADALPGGPLANTSAFPGSLNTPKSMSGSIAGPLFASGSTGAQMAMSGIASAGALYAGVQGVIGGFKKGGAQGTINAIGSAAGTAAAFDPEPISKSILAGVAMVSGVVSSIIGDPKQKFATQQANDLRDNHWFGPQQLNVSSDSNGNLVSTGFKGNVRSTDSSAFAMTDNASHYQNDRGTWDVVPGQVTQQYKAGPQITLNADFVDPAGLQARSNDIADAVQTAMLRGHPINDTVSQAGK